MESLEVQLTKGIKSILKESKPSLHEPRFNEKETKFVLDCLNSTFVSSVGEYVDKFENNLAKLTNCKRAIAIVNGTSALHLALKIAGVKKNHEVICPTLTFIATCNAIKYLNAVPHFVDSNEKTLGIDPIALREWLKISTIKKSNQTFNKNTGRVISAIIPMHTFGHLVEIDDLIDIAQEYNLELIEDAAESLGSTFKGRHAGTFGKLGVISFNGNKIITTGGGGAIITNDDNLANLAKHLSSTARQKHKWRIKHDDIGFNYRLPNINAALGCGQLENFSSLLASKRKLYDKYKEVFRSIKGIKLFSEPEFCKSNYWLQTLILDKNEKHRLEKIICYTNEEGISTRPLWELNHRTKMYNHCPRSPLPVAESLSERIINIPSSSFLV